MTCSDELSSADLHIHKCNFSVPYYNIKVLCSICGDAISAFNITTHHIHCEREKAPNLVPNPATTDEDETNNYIVVNDGNNIDYLFNDNDGSDDNDEPLYRPKYSPIMNRPEHNAFMNSDDEDAGLYGYEYKRDKSYREWDVDTKIKYSDDEDPYNEFYRSY
jgi:hypothetical protein